MASYLLEQLGPERFQELIQALLTAEYPEVQCLPVAQPDGGRDAFMGDYPQPGKELTIFQVKYVREPERIADRFEWIKGVIDGEREKIDRLIDRGATKYVLISNVQGSAHLDAGTIDKANRYLRNSMSIESRIWWRDDVNRRLDVHEGVKHSYIDIMRANDLPGWILKHVDSCPPHHLTTIRAFLAAQKEIDETVRFKQVELQSDLLDLFVDGPITMDNRAGAGGEDSYEKSAILEFERLVSAEDGTFEEEFQPSLFRLTFEAAALLLDTEAQNRMPLTVIEGAPGQGKSTLVQFVSQVHRLYLLNDPAVERLKTKYQLSNARLPIKIDLREYAVWIEGKDPFNFDTNDQPKDRNSAKSLESFIAALIGHYSGGVEFSTSDLHSVISERDILVVLDGLDEVANLDCREQMISEIRLSSRRLSEVASSAQMIVTARPSAFTGVDNTLPKDQFTYLSLGSLTQDHIQEYTDKWSEARSLSEIDSQQLKRMLNARLGQPHIRELARNPMQLAILLSLVYSKGESLPDKRTDLYTSYVDRFLDRESEKSEIVRSNRSLLVDVHGYLAWKLHAEAERQSDIGRISTEKLIESLAEYLSSEGWNEAGLVETLFAGSQRVVFLVSRVEGTFEFEVQPLREYFAARYLYETRQYSPAGRSRTGALPDRFSALARNAYWFNVVRFFAGFLDKGEIYALLEGILELSEEYPFDGTSYPRGLAARLLCDWVFSQNQRCMQKIVSFIAEDATSLRKLGAYSVFGQRHERLSFPSGWARQQILSRTWDELMNTSESNFEQVRLLSQFIIWNSTSEERGDKWKELSADSASDDWNRWIALADSLNIVNDLTENDLRLETLIIERALSRDAWQSISANATVLASNPAYVRAYIDAVLDQLVVSPWVSSDGSIMHFASPFSLFRYDSVLYSPDSDIPLSEQGFQRFGSREEVSPAEWLPREGREFLAKYLSLATRSTAEWATDIGIWNELVEDARSQWGDRSAISQLAILAAFVRGLKPSVRSQVNLYDRDLPLCERTRAARLYFSGNTEWWRNQFENAQKQSECILVASMFALTAGPSVISKLALEFDSFYSNLDACDRNIVTIICGSIGPLVKRRIPRRSKQVTELGWVNAVTDDTAALLGFSQSILFQRKVYGARLLDRKPLSPLMQELFVEVLSREVREDLASESRWDNLLRFLDSTIVGLPVPISMNHGTDRSQISVALARRILKCDYIPASVVAFMENICESAAFAHTRPLIEIAEEDDWFALNL